MNKAISTPIAIIIIIVLAVLVGGLVVWQYWGSLKPETSEVEEREIIIPNSEEDCLSIEEPFYWNECFIDLAKKTKDESLCEKIKSLRPDIGEGHESRRRAMGRCYAQLSVLKNDPFLCEKAWNIEGTGRRDLSIWCKEYFENPNDFIKKGGDEYGFVVTLPKDWKCDGWKSYNSYHELYREGITCVRGTERDDIRFVILMFDSSYYFEHFEEGLSRLEEVTFEEYIIKEKQRIEKEWKIIKEEKIILDNLPAIKLTATGTEISRYLTRYETRNYEIFVQRGKKMFIIAVAIDPSKLETYELIFNQILSTFKFLD